jgi:hypothetical protein
MLGELASSENPHPPYPTQQNAEGRTELRPLKEKYWIYS